MKQTLFNLQNLDTTKNKFSKFKNLSSSLTSQKNKISKRKFILNSSRKKTKIIYYPTLNLSKRISQTIAKKKKRATKRFERIPYQLKYFESLQAKKFSKLEKLANSFFQLYSIDEDLTTCNHSVGNLIELNYNGIRKIVIVSITQCEDFEDRKIIYCSNRKDNNFLNFFEEASKFNNNSFKYNFFRFGKQNFDIHALSGSNIQRFMEILEEFRKLYKISEMEFCYLKRLFIAEAPIEILREIDYDSIPTINLNNFERNWREKNFVRGFNYLNRSISKMSDIPSNDSKIFLFAQNFNPDISEKKRNYLQAEDINSIIVNSNSLLSKEKLENTGELNVIYGSANCTEEILCKFEATCLTNGTGNLIYNADKNFRPIGINIGTATNIYNDIVENIFISLENETVLSFLKMYLIKYT